MPNRKPIRDTELYELSMKKLEGTLENQYLQPADPTYNRAFSWFANSSIPPTLQPLLQKYISWTHTFLADPRDTIFVSHVLFTFVFVIPSAVTLLFRFHWIHAILHTIGLVLTIPPFILMLHCVCHKKASKTAIPWLDYVIHYAMAPFYGQTWNTFYYHHVKHHHVEDNGTVDLSSTIWYDRDNWIHFAIYFFRFYFLIGLELPIYFFEKGQYRWGVNVFLGEYGTLALYSAFFLLVENPWSVIFSFFVPLNLSRYFLLM
jgi:hypothetical protein